MKLLLNAGTGFAVAAWLLGIGPFAGPPDPRWAVVKADLAAARPQERLAAQSNVVFAGKPHPVSDAH